MREEEGERGETNKREEKVLFSWSGPVRPFKKRGREFFSTVIALAILVGIIFFFIEGVMPVIVIGAVVFLVYILSTVPPGDVDYSITNRAIRVGEKGYFWEQMSRFYFTERWGQELLVVDMPTAFPGRLEMVLTGEIDKEALKEALLKYLPMEKTAPGFLDKAVKWLSDKIPLDK